MTDQEFDELLTDALMDAAWQRWEQVMDGPEELVWTPARRRKMDKLLRDPFVVSKRWARPKWQKVLSAVACCLLIVSTVFGGVMAISPDARAWVQSIVKEWTEIFTAYYFTGNSNTAVNGIWRLGKLPEDYVETDMNEADGNYAFIYTNSDGTELYYNFMTVKQGRRFNFDNEHSNQSEVLLNGQTAYLFESKQDDWPSCLVWFDKTESVSFRLIGYVDIDQLFEIAGSVYLEK